MLLAIQDILTSQGRPAANRSQRHSRSLTNVVEVGREQIDVGDTIIFATLNPESIGGGRQRLP